jgi:hypothetical protein
MPEMQTIKKDDKWSLPLPILSQARKLGDLLQSLFLDIQDRSFFFWCFYNANQNAMLSALFGSLWIMREPMKLNVANRRIAVMEIQVEWHGIKHPGGWHQYLPEYHVPTVFMGQLWCAGEDLQEVYYDNNNKCSAALTLSQMLFKVVHYILLSFSL